MRSRRHPSNIGQGLMDGSISFVSGFANGIAGVVLRPKEGLQREGGLGLIKGIGQGLGGLLLKPLSGIVDLTSKTAEGIKNSSKSLVNSNYHHPFALKRHRLGRALHSQGLVKPFDANSASLKLRI